MKPVSQPQIISLTGCLLPWSKKDAPIAFDIEGVGRFIPIFSSKEKLRQQMRQYRIRGYRIKTITDGKDFIESVSSQGIKVVLDPHLTDGVWRFKLCSAIPTQEPE